MAQEPPRFTNLRVSTNNETLLTLSVQPGVNYRIDAAQNLSDWMGLVTFAASSATSLQHTDSAAPLLDNRFYRAQELTETNVFAGDHLATTNGEVIIQPRSHATFVMSWSGKAIYVDPNDANVLRGLPKADLILVTHSHGDHFNTQAIDAVKGTNVVIVAPQDVYNRLSATQKPSALTLANGNITNVLGITIEAVPAYNANHARGQGNGYVVEIGGKRIYISGDTGATPEMRELSRIDIAFLCMNQPFTMTVNDATNVVSAFRPKIVYPYHYRDQSGTTTSAALFKQRLDPNLGIEVRLRKWY